MGHSLMALYHLVSVDVPSDLWTNNEFQRMQVMATFPCKVKSLTEKSQLIETWKCYKNLTKLWSFLKIIKWKVHKLREAGSQEFIGLFFK